ncbi:hypothetical protein [Candidatus Palauibacter polyketidifaciens]|nr:hypothetical protein [Candidatus Palauibacter polyketidifaciens]MDE2719304.1 hypothetical protein [Candidatus Palauibacter polyketidifaciens]
MTLVPDTGLPDMSVTVPLISRRYDGGGHDEANTSPPPVQPHRFRVSDS